MVNGLLLKLTLRELKRNWFEYLSMLLITLLAVTLFLGFISNSATLDRRAQLYYEEANLADLVVQTTGFDEDDLAYFDDLHAEYRIFSDGSFRKGGGTPDTVHIYIGGGEMNAPYITEGEKGVLVDARVASLRGYKVGDTITVSCTTLKDALSSRNIDPTFEAEITGLMHSVEGVNIYSVSPLLITEEVFEVKIVELAKEAYASLLDSGFVSEQFIVDTVKASLPRLRTQAVLKCDAPASLKEEIRVRFAEKEENNLVTVYDHDTMEAVVTIDSEVEQSYNMLYVFPVIFFFVSLLVIMTSVSRLILRERTHIGTFKALGLTNARITMHYAGFSAIVTFLGAAIGAVLGPLIVPTVMSIKYGLMFSMPLLAGTAVSVPWTIGTIAFVCLCAFLIGVWASRTVVRENPAECMRPKQTGFRPKANGKSIGGNKLLSLRMAVRNVRVGWGRALMTVVGIAGCSALLLTSFGIGDTLNASVANDFGGLFTFDVIAPNTAVAAAKLEELSADPAFAISATEEVHTYIVSAKIGESSRDITLYHVQENSCMCGVVGENGNAMSESVAEDLGVSVGDMVTLILGSEQVEYRVEALVETSTWNGFFVTENKLSAPAPSGNYWIQTGEPRLVADALNEAAGTVSAKTMEDRIAEIENVISTTNTMKYTLMAFAVMLSVVVLYNLSLLNVKERTRDMATLKVLGFTHFRIALSLVFEIMMLTVLGTAIGAALGYPLCMLVMHINEVSVMGFIVTIEPLSYLYSVLISLGTAGIINLIFGALISTISMTESLKSVE